MDVSDILYFFCSGEGKGESEAPGGWGGRSFYGKSQEEGSTGWVGARGRGAGRVFAGNLGGDGAIFFFGAEIPTKGSFYWG